MGDEKILDEEARNHVTLIDERGGKKRRKNRERFTEKNFEVKSSRPQ